MAIDAGRATILAAAIGATGAIIVALITLAAKDDNKSSSEVAKGLNVRPSAAITLPPSTAPIITPTLAEGSSAAVVDTGPEPDFVKRLKVPLTNYTSIQLSKASIEQSVGVADLYYAPKNEKPTIEGGFAKVSAEVEVQSKDGCLDAVQTRPALEPISRLKVGQAICATRSDWVALLVVTSAPNSEGTLGLQLSFWG